MWGNSLLTKENITLESIPALNATEIRFTESASSSALITSRSSTSIFLYDLFSFSSLERLFLFCSISFGVMTLIPGFGKPRVGSYLEVNKLLIFMSNSNFRTDIQKNICFITITIQLENAISRSYCGHMPAIRREICCIDEFDFD